MSDTPIFDQLARERVARELMYVPIRFIAGLPPADVAFEIQRQINRMNDRQMSTSRWLG